MTPLERCSQLLRMKVAPERLTELFGERIVEKALKEIKPKLEQKIK